MSMSKEFLDWIEANGFCGGECANGRDICDVSSSGKCDVVLMWPEIRYSTMQTRDKRLEIVTIECVGYMDEPFTGPPVNRMASRPLILPMSSASHEAYERAYVEQLENTKLKERIQELEEHARMRFGLCANKEDHEPHPVKTGSLAPYWCCANQCAREPYASEQRRKVQEQINAA